MYLVTKKTAINTISTNVFTDRLNAEIKRDIINHTSDEYSGAILEEIYVSDLESVRSKEYCFEMDTDFKDYDSIKVSYYMDDVDWGLYFYISASNEISDCGDIEWTWKIDDEMEWIDDNEELKFKASSQTIVTLKVHVSDWLNSDNKLSMFETDEMHNISARLHEGSMPR